jgi:hypothetical protein
MSGSVRIRIYKRAATQLGVAEATLLDVPIVTSNWSQRDWRALEHLERIAGADPAPASAPDGDSHA